MQSRLYIFPALRFSVLMMLAILAITTLAYKGSASQPLLQEDQSYQLYQKPLAILSPDGRKREFQVRLADTFEERMQGLMFVQEMEEHHGMLFVFEQPQPLAFWMKNTLIPLDMIYADENGVIRNIIHNAVPLDETPRPSGFYAKYVLEINGGLSDKLGIRLGHRIVFDKKF